MPFVHTTFMIKFLLLFIWLAMLQTKPVNPTEENNKVKTGLSVCYVDARSPKALRLILLRSLYKHQLISVSEIRSR